MKIAIITPSYPSKNCGISTYTASLGEELQNYTDVNIIGKEKFRFINLLNTLKSFRGSELVHIQFAPGIYGYMGLGVVPLLITIKSLKKPLVTTIHELPFLQERSIKNWLANYYFKILFMLVVGLSDKLIVHNEVSKQYFSNHNLDGNLDVVPHGTISPKKRIDRLVRDSEVVIGFLGFIQENKGIHRLIKVLPHLPQIKLVIAGKPKSKKDQYYMDRMIELSCTLNVADKVNFIGYVADEELADFYESVDLMIFPYTSITESGALHLALAHNSLCLVSNIPAFQEFYQRYGCVELFDLDSEMDFIKKIQNLLSNYPKKLEIIQNQQAFLAETSWKNSALRTMEVYKSVTS